jgi:hypothetical protein
MKRNLATIVAAIPTSRLPISYCINGLDSGILYYLRVTSLSNPNLKVYKVGYTSKSIDTRLKAMINNHDTQLTILDGYVFSEAHIANSYEKYILQQYKKYRYYGKPLIRSGNSELFSSDILGLDHSDAINRLYTCDKDVVDTFCSCTLMQRIKLKSTTVHTESCARYR